ncbi:MAG: hypothetical protein PHS30_06335 [Bacteroidales bacterium]|nr:hypothetical protein [Bacteroidales bacterium]
MKKNICRLGSILLLAVTLFSACSEDALIKSEVDDKYNTVHLFPTLTIAHQANLTGVSVDLGVTLSSTENIAEVGFLRATTTNFVNAMASSCDLTAGGLTFSKKVGLSPLTKYYVKAYVIDSLGAVKCSDVISFTTPNATFLEKISGTYKASITDAWDDVYNSRITILPHEDAGKVYVHNLEPFFFTSGLEAPDYNVFVGTYDETTATITIQAGQLIGYADIALKMEDPSLTALVFDVKDNGTTLDCQDSWGVYSGDWWGLYPGGYSYVKQ